MLQCLSDTACATGNIFPYYKKSALVIRRQDETQRLGRQATARKSRACAKTHGAWPKHEPG
jgi:hypothetical protein